VLTFDIPNELKLSGSANQISLFIWTENLKLKKFSIFEKFGIPLAINAMSIL